MWKLHGFLFCLQRTIGRQRSCYYPIGSQQTAAGRLGLGIQRLKPAGLPPNFLVYFLTVHDFIIGTRDHRG